MRQKIDWANHLVELLVVFIGITAAFSLNNWQEGRNSKKLERYYLESLAKDLEQDAAQLQELIELGTSNLEAVQKLQQILKRKEYDDASILALAGKMSTVEKFVPHSTTYEALKAAGDLDIITDLRLKTQASELYNLYAETRQRDEIYLDFNKEYIIPLFFENFDFGNDFTPVNPNYMKQSAFSNLVFGFILTYSQKLDGYRTGLDKCTALKSELEAALD